MGEPGAEAAGAGEMAAGPTAASSRGGEPSDAVEGAKQTGDAQLPFVAGTASGKETVAAAEKWQTLPAPAEIGQAASGGNKPDEERAAAAKKADGNLAVGEHDPNQEAATEAIGGKSAIAESPPVGTVRPAVDGVVSGERAAAAGTTDSIDGAAGAAAAGPDLTAATGDPGADDLNRLAALPPDSPDSDSAPGAEETAKRETSHEDRSLKCDVVRLLGQAIGRWRLSGEERQPATDKAIDEVVRETNSVRDKRFKFSGRVYGMLIYELKQDHTPDAFGAYAHAACLILRGHKGLIPADDVSDARLDQALRSCESGSRGADDLNACISERMEQIVRERGRRPG